jgi:hypothetical protein
MTAHPDQRSEVIQLDAELSPPPPGEQQWWWMQQVSQRMGRDPAQGETRRFFGASSGKNHYTLHVQVSRDELEAAVRQLRQAVEDASESFEERYVADERARDEARATEAEVRRRQQESDQAVLDRVMAE